MKIQNIKNDANGNKPLASLRLNINNIEVKSYTIITE